MTKQRLDAKGVNLIDTPTNGGVHILYKISCSFSQKKLIVLNTQKMEGKDKAFT